MKLLRLDVRCPECGAPPAVRVHPDEVKAKLSDDPDRVVFDVQCQQCMRERKRVVYEVTVGAILKAS